MCEDGSGEYRSGNRSSPSGAVAGAGAPGPVGAGYRVLFLLRLRPGAQEEFLRAYDAIRWSVRDVPGYLGDQVCRSTHEPRDWMITSQWRSADDFRAWERTPEHRELAAPMLAAVVWRRSLRYVVHRETTRQAAATEEDPWNDMP